MKLRFLAFALALLALGISVSILADDGGNTYVVQRGDSLSKIAAEHGTTVQELVRLNADRYPSLKTNPGLIEPGWVLVLPDTPDTGGGEKNNENPNVLERAITWVKTQAIPAVQKWSREVFRPFRSPAQPRASSGDSSGNVPRAIQIGDPVAEEEILRMFNEERQAKGVPALVMDEQLRSQCRERSRDMLEREYFSHYDPLTGAYLGGATTEIITKGCGFAGNAQTGAKSWWRSPGHYQAIVTSDFRRVGIGVAYGKGCTIITAQFLP